MKQMTFPLVKTIQRPIVYLKDWHNIYAMIDTGSLFPIWVAREDALLDLGAELLNGDVEFGGFGGKAKGRLYKMLYFRLGDLIYPDFQSENKILSGYDRIGEAGSWNFCTIEWMLGKKWLCMVLDHGKW